jgi:hypothetical protein
MGIRQPAHARGRVPKAQLLIAAGILLLGISGAQAQDDYEIQVYASETVPPGMTMFELHSNFTVRGERQELGGVEPSNHALHETIEITHGFTPWFETGFYVFTSVQPAEGWEWVGDHIRPRVRVPEDWEWPVGVSLSTEIGYQRRRFSEDTWTWELRPILDKQWGPWYFSINPAFEKSLEGLNEDHSWSFAPSAKFSVDVIPELGVGAEYYSSLGPVTHLSPASQQQHQIFPAIDLNVSPDLELNFGVGWGLTSSTDRLVVKLILGWRF